MDSPCGRTSRWLTAGAAAGRRPRRRPAARTGRRSAPSAAAGGCRGARPRRSAPRTRAASVASRGRRPSAGAGNHTSSTRPLVGDGGQAVPQALALTPQPYRPRRQAPPPIWSSQRLAVAARLTRPGSAGVLRWPVRTLDLTADGAALTAALVDLPSVSGTEGPLADAVRGGAAGASPAWRWSGTATRCSPAPTLGRPRRVLLAGHLDTVPVADNLPSRVDGDVLYGCGTSDMKSGVAVLLRLGATLAAAPELADDLTLVCYDNEEVEATRNGLGRVARTRPELARRGPRDPAGADLRAGRGRLPGHAAGRGPHRRAAGAQRAVLARASTRCTPPRRCSPGSPRTSRARSTSTAAPTGRGSTRSASPAGSPATCCRTSAW